MSLIFGMSEGVSPVRSLMVSSFLIYCLVLNFYLFISALIYQII